jgi:hypothetical protein
MYDILPAGSLLAPAHRGPARRGKSSNFESDGTDGPGPHDTTRAIVAIKLIHTLSLCGAAHRPGPAAAAARRWSCWRRPPATPAYRHGRPPPGPEPAAAVTVTVKLESLGPSRDDSDVTRTHTATVTQSQDQPAGLPVHERGSQTLLRLCRR